MDWFLFLLFGCVCFIFFCFKRNLLSASFLAVVVVHRSLVLPLPNSEVLLAASALVALLRGDWLEVAVLKPVSLQNASHLRDVDLEGRPALLLNHREDQGDEVTTRLHQLGHGLHTEREVRLVGLLIK